jgi:predicted regulator of Ras-like GTPase activity (Roadblock/LC7/MglB family)
MDAQQALADLTEISSQIQAAVVFDETGKVAAATVDESRAEALARGAGRLLDAALEIKPGEDAQLIQLEAATQEGSVFVVADGTTRIVATTAPEPTVGLVFYDLKSALRSIATKPKPAPRKRAAAPKKAAASKPAAAKKKPAPRKKKTDDAS